jgi:hypothetical protein
MFKKNLSFFKRQKNWKENIKPSKYSICQNENLKFKLNIQHTCVEVVMVLYW